MNYLKKNHFIVNFIWRKKKCYLSHFKHLLNFIIYPIQMLPFCFLKYKKKIRSSLYNNMLNSCFWSIICTSRIFWIKLSLLNFTKSYFSILFFHIIIDMRGIHLKCNSTFLVIIRISFTSTTPHPPPSDFIKAMNFLKLRLKQIQGLCHYLATVSLWYSVSSRLWGPNRT